MKMYLITLVMAGSLTGCKLSDLIGGGSSSSSSSAPRNCVQQVEPKNPAIPCKIGDWYAEGDAKCSSSLERCLAK